MYSANKKIGLIRIKLFESLNANKIIDHDIVRQVLLKLEMIHFLIIYYFVQSFMLGTQTAHLLNNNNCLTCKKIILFSDFLKLITTREKLTISRFYRAKKQ